MLNLNKHTKTKNKPTVNFNNCSYICVRIIVHNCRTQHSRVLIIFPIILQFSVRELKMRYSTVTVK